MSDELPKGWCDAAISDVAEVFLGKTPAKADYVSNGSLKVVKFRDIQESQVDFANAKNGFVSENGDAVSGLRELRRGDVLITSAAHSSENIGKKCAYVSNLPEHFAKVFFTGELLNIRCPDDTLSWWAYLFFRSVDGFAEIQEAVTGVHLTGGRAKQMRLPLAPLPEQRRIVAKLETLLGKVDASQQRLAKIPVLLKRLRQSVLAAACSGRLTADWREEHDLDDEWPVEPLSEFFEMRNGKSLVATKRKNGDIPVYGGNGLMGTHNEANADGLVIVIGRVGAQCGNVHYVIGKVWVTDNAISLQGKKELTPAFYAFFLRSLNLNTLSAGTGQPYVSQEILGPIETPVVSLAEQQEIVRRVEGMFALADQLELRLAKARGQVDHLTPSLLARAFAGKLVPQDPTDEPASELLARIRGEKTNQTQRGASGIYQASQRRRRKNLAGADISTLV